VENYRTRNSKSANVKEVKMVLIFNGTEEGIIDALIENSKQFLKLNSDLPLEIVEYSLQDIMQGKSVYKEIFDYIQQHYQETNIIYKHGYIDEVVQHELVRGTPPGALLKFEEEIFAADNDLKNNLHNFTVVKDLIEIDRVFHEQFGKVKLEEMQKIQAEFDAKMKEFSPPFYAYNTAMNASKSNRSQARNLQMGLDLLNEVLIVLNNLNKGITNEE
jgi:hypothetical protein